MSSAALSVPAPQSVDTVVFDLDGTLVDTVAGITASVNAALRERGVPELGAEEVRGKVGLGGTALVRFALGAAGRSPSDTEVAEVQQAYLARYAADPGHLATVYPGVVDLLGRLRHDGVRLALCTNKAGVIVTGLLSAVTLDRWFDVVVSGDSLPYRKPDPRMLWHTVSASGGRHAMMVGDSRTDVDGARAAGMPVACVAFGYHDGDVHDLAADVVVEHFDGLLAATRAAGIRLGAANGVTTSP